MDTPSRPMESNMVYVTDVRGWACQTCRHVYADSPSGKHAAGYCCATDRACETEGCSGRAWKSYILCDSCREKKDLERYQKLPEVVWDGETPLVEWDDDQFFFAPEDLEEYLAEDDSRKLEDLRLVICQKVRKPHFDMSEFIGDYLGEHDSPEDPVKLEARVNAWIEKNVPVLWEPGKERPSLESLKRFITEPSC